MSTSYFTTHLTASPEEVRDLGYPNIVCHVRLASGGGAPVDANTAILQDCIQLVFTKDLLARNKIYHTSLYTCSSHGEKCTRMRQSQVKKKTVLKDTPLAERGRIWSHCKH